MKCALLLQTWERNPRSDLTFEWRASLYAELTLTAEGAPAQTNARSMQELKLGPSLVYDCHTVTNHQSGKLLEWYCKAANELHPTNLCRHLRPVLEVFSPFLTVHKNKINKSSRLDGELCQPVSVLLWSRWRKGWNFNQARLMNLKLQNLTFKKGRLSFFTIQ